jgi:4-hydroxy-tetrahydrodipicolinate synthase
MGMGPACALDLERLPALLDHVAGLGCHGVLLAGSTGEGPSLSAAERASLVAAAVAWREDRAREGFHLLAGSGAAALPTAIEATRACLAAGADAVVVQPPFYFRGASADGLLAWFVALVEAAVPPGARLLLYDIPRLTGVPLPFEVVEALFARFPRRVVGIKDSRGDQAYAARLCRALPQGSVFTGSDPRLAAMLSLGAAGSITALAPLHGDCARAVWDVWRRGGDPSAAQSVLAAVRAELDQAPTVAAVKAVLAARGLAIGPPRPPLTAMDDGAGTALSEALVRATR